MMQTIFRRLGILFILAFVAVSLRPAAAQEATTGIRRAADKQAVVNFTELAQRRLLNPVDRRRPSLEEKPRPFPRRPRQLIGQAQVASPALLQTASRSRHHTRVTACRRQLPRALR